MKWFVCLFAVLVTVVSTPAEADWRHWRRDAGRTALAPGASALRRPGRVWRSYLGGSLTGNQLHVLDVDGDAVPEVLHVAGGRLLARSADGSLRWTGRAYGLDTIIAVTDLDGDGTTEVVATGTPFVVAVFRPPAAAAVWT